VLRISDRSRNTNEVSHHNKEQSALYTILRSFSTVLVVFAEHESESPHNIRTVQPYVRHNYYVCVDVPGLTLANLCVCVLYVYVDV
jgi:hypothetical protein